MRCCCFLDQVATGHTEEVKPKSFVYPPARADSMSLHEPRLLEKTELTVDVRTAKDQLSNLLEQAAQGNEVIITSDGVPKARLVPIRAGRRPLRVDWEFLRALRSRRRGPASEELIRADRDGRASLCTSTLPF
jgi:prevent-host-death family protein